MTAFAPSLIAQVSDDTGRPRLAMLENGKLRVCEAPVTTYDAAIQAINNATSLRSVLETLPWATEADLAIYADQFLSPVTHPDPAHLLVTGTGLTHLGSADARDRMHAATKTSVETDSMRMFRMGLESGRPEAQRVGVQPEWFYKGDGDWIVPPGGTLVSPGWADDAGEEPELAAVYLNSPDGTPHRLGFALANEFSDHVMERQNYLWLAHSKLRPCSIGPCLRVGDLPQDLEGVSRIWRNGSVLWEGTFATGEANMSHAIKNLEHHHFKYMHFRRPGDVHIHMLGTATLSHVAGIICQDGDVFEIDLPGFGLPLVNTLRQEDASLGRTNVKVL